MLKRVYKQGVEVQKDLRGRVFLADAVALVLAGLALGLAAASAAARLLTSQLYGVESTDATTFVLGSLILAGVALVACAVPARRATRVDPMVALRYE